MTTNDSTTPVTPVPSRNEASSRYGSVQRALDSLRDKPAATTTESQRRSDKPAGFYTDLARRHAANQAVNGPAYTD